MTELLKEHKDNPATAYLRQIAWDVDNILYPTIEAVQKWAPFSFAHQDIEYYEQLIEHLGGIESAQRIFSKAFSYQHSMETGLNPGCLQVMTQLSELGIKHHILTERPVEFCQQTKQFLIDQGIVFDTFNCQQPIDKIAICQQLNVSLIVDDKNDFIIAADKSGLDVVSLSFAYNENVLQKLNKSLNKNWSDLEKDIITILEDKLSRSGKS